MRPGEDIEETLPWNHCRLSLLEAKTPYALLKEVSARHEYKFKYAGIVFDLLSLGELEKQERPVKLHFHRNTDGLLHCPVTYKLLTKKSVVVSIATTGNVYSLEAYEELNEQ